MRHRCHVKQQKAVAPLPFWVCGCTHTQAHTHERACVVAVLSLSHVHSSVTPWTAARQAPLSVGSPRQKYWSGLPFPSPGDLPHPGIEPLSPALADGFSTTEPTCTCVYVLKLILTLVSLLGVSPLWEPLAWLTPIIKWTHNLDWATQPRPGLDSGVGASEESALLWSTRSYLSHQPAEGRRFETWMITGGFCRLLGQPL